MSIAPEANMTNPYAPPEHHEGPAALAQAVIPNAAEIRAQHLLHERNLRQCTLALVGFIYLGMTAVIIASMILQPLKSAQWPIVIGLAIYSLGGLLAGVPIAIGVFWRAAWARLPLFVLALASLVIFPFGTALGIEIVRCLMSGPEPKLLTPLYAEVVRQTPQFTPRTSFLTWVGLVLIIILVISIALVSQIPPEIRHAH
jgi:hypothetical protein